MNLRSFHAVAAVLAMSTVAAGARAQCEGWLSGEGVPGLDGAAYCELSWDPNGAGPERPLLIVGGSFWIAGSEVCRNIAAWNGES